MSKPTTTTTASKPTTAPAKNGVAYMPAKNANSSTIIRRAYTLQGQTIRNDWELARYVHSLPTGKGEPTQSERVDVLNSEFSRAAKPGEPVITFTQSRFSQLKNAWATFGELLDSVTTVYAPTTAYQLIGKAAKDEDRAGRIALFDSIGELMAERTAARHKGAHDAAMTRKAAANESEESEEADETGGDSEWATALKDLHELAKALDMTPAELLRNMLEDVQSTLD